MTKRIAVVTGGARGLGRAMVEKFLSNNYRVEAWDLKFAESHASADLKEISLDVTDEKAVETASKNLVSQWGPPDVVVNNAGITRDMLIHKMSLQDFEATYKVNVVGTFLPTKYLGQAMRDQNSQLQKEGKNASNKRIIMMSSIAGVFGNVGQANYAASKAAVIGMAKSLAKEWGRFNISVNAIAPGVMQTEMIKSIPQEILNSFVERTPLKRLGTADELADFVIFLADPKASFLTGDVINFSGGLLL